jgi:benzoate membrane transport protein
MFVLLSARPALARFMPPVIGALLAGALASALNAQPGSLRLPALELAAPVFSAPELSWQAMVELVVPLAITVLVVQNGQGVAVLSAAGHKPPVNSVTVACGLWSMLAGLVGTACTCLTGPTNAIVVGSGERARHYTAALFVGLLALFFGLFSTSFTQLMLAAPSAFVATLAGLAMLKVLQGAFVASFRTRFTLGALVSFVVTVANVPIAGVGAPFWGLVFGFAASWLLERDDFRQEKAGGR